MKNPLNKRMLRELRGEMGKYAVIAILLVATIGFVSGFLVAGSSMIAAYNEGFEKYNIEDGHFHVEKQLNRAQLKALTGAGVTLYDLHYREAAIPNGSTLRIYPDRTQVNTVCLMQGTMPAARGEIGIDRMYAENNGIAVGDTLTDENGEELAITKGFNSSSYLVLPQSQAVRTPEMKQSGIIYTNVLTTSDKAYIKSNVTESTTIDRQANDETGAFAIAVAADKPNYDDESLTSRVFVVGNAYFLASESYFTAYDNGTLMLSPMEWLVNRDTTVYVPAKSLGSYTMSIPDNTTYQILTVTVIVAIPVIILLVGFIVWRRRRHL